MTWTCTGWCRPPQSVRWIHISTSTAPRRYEPELGVYRTELGEKYRIETEMNRPPSRVQWEVNFSFPPPCFARSSYCYMVGPIPTLLPTFRTTVVSAHIHPPNDEWWWVASGNCERMDGSANLWKKRCNSLKLQQLPSVAQSDDYPVGRLVGWLVGMVRWSVGWLMMALKSLLHAYSPVTVDRRRTNVMIRWEHTERSRWWHNYICKLLYPSIYDRIITACG